MNNLERLEKQVILWSRAAIWVPTFFTLLLLGSYTANIFHITTLFYFACGLYFITAVIWWWWTMKSIHILVNIMQRANINLEKTVEELSNIRNDIRTDNTI